MTARDCANDMQDTDMYALLTGMPTIRQVHSLSRTRALLVTRVHYLHACCLASRSERIREGTQRNAQQIQSLEPVKLLWCRFWRRTPILPLLLLYKMLTIARSLARSLQKRIIPKSRYNHIAALLGNTIVMYGGSSTFFCDSDTRTSSPHQCGFLVHLVNSLVGVSWLQSFTTKYGSWTSARMSGGG